VNGVGSRLENHPRQVALLHRHPDVSGPGIHRAFDTNRLPAGASELWPTLVEICYFQNSRHGLPQVRVNNHKKPFSNGRTPHAS